MIPLQLFCARQIPFGFAGFFTHVAGAHLWDVHLWLWILDDSRLVGVTDAGYLARGLFRF